MEQQGNEEIVALLKEILRNQQAGLEIRAKASRTIKWLIMPLFVLLLLIIGISLIPTHP
jgi:hypothetical protein